LTRAPSASDDHGQVGWRVSFPPETSKIGDERFLLCWDDGREERLRLHDYARIYAVPGLYEEVVQQRLDCRTPAQLAALVDAAVGQVGWARSDVRLFELAAGNGVSGEELAAKGLRISAGVDILPEARAAALRDRPGLYDVYLTGNPRALGRAAANVLRGRHLNVLVAGSIGAGHLCPAGLAAALDLLTPEALVAYTTETGVRDPDVVGVLALMGRLARAGALREIARERYRHRLTTSGGERWYEAVVAHVFHEAGSPLPAS
jgi:hypothetical protein